ncbi:MAG: LysE family translocator [Actinomycetota bacterium]|nr:LysE family translocator [Actinomycetota bacterium]
MSSWPSFLLVAVVVSLTPGPATATIIRTSARSGRRTALAAIAGNSVGVLLWAALSAVGVSSLILASRIAYDALKLGGAVVLVTLGIRSLLHSRRAPAHGPVPTAKGVAAGWRAGVLTGVANPKLAVFFIALFPQFLDPDAPVLPYALLMALVVVAVDVIWFSTLAIAVDRAGSLLRPRVNRWLERTAGAVMVALGTRLAVESG